MAWLRSVYFINQNRGWVAGSNGTLLQTSDDGKTWKKLPTPSKDTLLDVYFADERVGWVLADRDLLKINSNDEPRSYLMKTEDAGLTWRLVFFNNGLNPRLLHIIFADSQHGFVFGESGVVYGTRDGGAHWLREPSPTKHLLLGGAFLDYAHAWLVGAGGTVAQTTDGGATWQAGFVRDDNNARFTAASFVSANLGWAVGASGQVFATRDGGRTWNPQRSNLDNDLFDVKFVDALEGWAAGDGGVLLHTTNGGARWVVESSPTTHALNHLFFVDRDHGWAVGFGGTILTTGAAQAPSLRN